MLEQHITEELIFLDWNALDRNDLFRKISNVLYEKKFVEDKFYEFLCKRENNYPTGLQLDTHTVAIPHGDPKYIKESFISVVRLKKPITMHKMEDSDEKISVDLFFFLGLNDGEKHLGILKKLIGLIQKESFFNELKEAKTPEELIENINRAERY